MTKEKSARLAWTGNDLDLDVTFPNGYETQMSAPTGGDGVSPMEFFLAGAAGCTAMDVIAVLKKKRQPVTNIEIEVKAEQAEGHPQVYTSGLITFVVTGDGVDPKAVERAISLSQDKYCSASIMLKRAGMDLQTAYRIEQA